MLIAHAAISKFSSILFCRKWNECNERNGFRENHAENGNYHRVNLLHWLDIDDSTNRWFAFFLFLPLNVDSFLSNAYHIAWYIFAMLRQQWQLAEEKRVTTDRMNWWLMNLYCFISSFHSYLDLRWTKFVNIHQFILIFLFTVYPKKWLANSFGGIEMYSLRYGDEIWHISLALILK